MTRLTGRSGVDPQLSLPYNSQSGNGPFGGNRPDSRFWLEPLITRDHPQKAKLAATAGAAEEQRMWQSGMFWTVGGANAIIALRCCRFNQRFEDFWAKTRAA